MEKRKIGNEKDRVEYDDIFPMLESNLKKKNETDGEITHARFFLGGCH